MRARELIFEAYYDPEKDEQSKAKLTDTRRPRLTLKHLNTLRRIKEIRKLELLGRKESLSRIYGMPAAEGGMPPGM